MQALLQGGSWSIKATKKPTVETINYEEEKRQNYDQDVKLNRQLLQTIRVTDSLVNQLENVISHGKIHDHLEQEMAARITNLKKDIGVFEQKEDTVDEKMEDEEAQSSSDHEVSKLSKVSKFSVPIDVIHEIEDCENEESVSDSDDENR